MIRIIDVKETLAEALMKVSKHKHVDKITVSDIVAACNTSRRTFYNHFADKYDLIAWIYTSRCEQIMSLFETANSWQECMIRIYEVFLDNREFFSHIIDQEGQNSFYVQFYEHTYTYMRSIITSRLHTEQIPENLDYALTAHVYGQVNCCAKWIREGFLIPPVQMAEYNVQNMPSVLRPFYMNEI